MDRRDFLRDAATGAAGVGTVALGGCLDGGSRAGTPRKTYNYDTASPTPTAVVSGGDLAISTPSAGELLVTVTVYNQTDAEQTAEVTATVTFEDDPVEQTKTVTLDAGGSKAVEFSFERPEDAPTPTVEFDIRTRS
jgi:hypothetical protein